MGTNDDDIKETHGLSRRGFLEAAGVATLFGMDEFSVVTRLPRRRARRRQLGEDVINPIGSAPR